MTVAQFEEREFGEPLNAQLTGGSGLFWPPGQVLEHVVGFDAALMVTDVAFWASIGFGAAPAGLVIQRSWWPGWPSHLLRPLFAFRTPPPFRLNLFLQHKRPEHLTFGKEWKHWKAAYYRFVLTPHQQRALEACANSLGPAGYVAYGSPAFHLRPDLFAHIEHRTLAANTHFAPALSLVNHARYTYVAARAAGQAHSEPVKVQPLLFMNGPPHEPPKPPSDGSGGDGPTPEELLDAAKKAARAAVEASPAIVGNREAFERAIVRARGLLDLLGPGLDGHGRTAADAFTVAAIFARMSGVQWMVSG